MEIKYIVLVSLFSVILVACGGDDAASAPTGTDAAPVDVQQVADLQAQIASLEAQIAVNKESETTTTGSCGVQEIMIKDLEENLASQIKVNKQQRQVLIELDDECAELRDEDSSCSEDLEAADAKNAKLQKLVDVCQEDLE